MLKKAWTFLFEILLLLRSTGARVQKQAAFGSESGDTHRSAKDRREYQGPFYFYFIFCFCLFSFRAHMEQIQEERGRYSSMGEEPGCCWSLVLKNNGLVKAPIRSEWVMYKQDPTQIRPCSLLQCTSRPKRQITYLIKDLQTK